MKSLLLLLVTVSAFAHQGRTRELTGCHSNNILQDGTVHCHNGPFRGEKFKSEIEMAKEIKKRWAEIERYHKSGKRVSP
jgi:hypothetical protein